MKLNRVSRNAMLGVLVGCSWSAIAHAQVTEQGPAQVEDAAPSNGEIIVTARKREENLRDVPISITAVGGEAIAERQIVNQAELSFSVASYQQTNGVNVASFMRGIGSGSNPSFEQAVGTFVDGIYAGRGAQQTYPYFDLERAEVLRGPQVTLYGNSAIAGAVNAISRKPGDELTGDFKASYEFNNRQVKLEGGITVPVTDKLSVRAAGFVDILDEGWLTTYRPLQFPGWSRNDPTWRNWGGRLSARYEFSPDVDLALKYEITDLKRDGNTLQPVANAGTPSVTEFVFDRERTFGNGPPLPDYEFDAMLMKSQTVQGTLSVETGLGTVSATSAYVWYDWFLNTEADMTPTPQFNFSHTENFNLFSQELRLTSDGEGSFDYIAGVFFQRDNLFLEGDFEGNLAEAGAPLPPFARIIRLDQRTDSYSGFFDGTYKITDRLTLNLGARYLHTKKTASQYSHAHDIVGNAPRPDLEVPLFPNGPSLFSIVFGQPHIFNDLELTENHFMPLAGLKYQIADDHMAYVKVTKGAKAGGFDWAVNHLNPDDVDFKPEKATSYEIGIRGNFRDLGVTYGLTVYQMDVDDLQVSAFDGNLGYIVGNAAAARSKGVEAELSWSPTSNLRLNGSMGYTDAKYVTFPGAACYVELRAATPAGTTCVRDMSGERLPFTSKWSYSLSAQHTLELGGFDIKSNVDYNYRSSTNVAAITDPGQWERPVGLLNARIAISPEVGGWQIALFGKNLTDELFSTYGTEAPSNNLVRLRDTERPRQYGVELGWSF